MDKTTPVHTLEECFEYLGRNAWQFTLLGESDPVRINAKMLRALYYHIGKQLFGNDNHPEEMAELMRHYAAIGSDLNGS